MALTLGACTYSWLWDHTLQDAVRRIADMGFRYFELMSHVPHCWPRGWTTADRIAFREIVDRKAPDGSNLASLKRVDFCFVVVSADDMVPGFGQAAAGDQSDVSASNYGDSHLNSLVLDLTTAPLSRPVYSRKPATRREYESSWGVLIVPHSGGCCLA